MSDVTITNKLFVSGIPWSIEWQELKDIFKEHGDVVHAKIVKDRETGRSKGFGFVEFSNEEDATKAKEAMD
jgi:RNA recognition motif-containing protein